MLENDTGCESKENLLNSKSLENLENLETQLVVRLVMMYARQQLAPTSSCRLLHPDCNSCAKRPTGRVWEHTFYPPSSEHELLPNTALGTTQNSCLFGRPIKFGRCWPVSGSTGQHTEIQVRKSLKHPETVAQAENIGENHRNPYYKSSLRAQGQRKACAQSASERVWSCLLVSARTGQRIDRIGPHLDVFHPIPPIWHLFH